MGGPIHALAVEDSELTPTHLPRASRGTTCTQKESRSRVVHRRTVREPHTTAVPAAGRRRPAQPLPSTRVRCVVRCSRPTAWRLWLCRRHPAVIGWKRPWPGCRWRTTSQIAVGTHALPPLSQTAVDGVCTVQRRFMRLPPSPLALLRTAFGRDAGVTHLHALCMFISLVSSLCPYTRPASPPYQSRPPHPPATPPSPLRHFPLTPPRP